MKTSKTIGGGALALLALTTTAFGGGFQRGTADTDILFEKAPVSSRFGVTYIDPNRGFSSINGVSGNYGDYTGTYLLPSAAIAVGNDVLGCSVSAIESFGAEADYGDGLPGQVAARSDGRPVGTDNADRLDFANATIVSNTKTLEFSSQEYGATCRVSHDVGKHRFSLLGGLFVEDLEFSGRSAGNRSLNGAFRGTVPGSILAASGAQLTLPSEIDVDIDDGFRLGYRIGAAYEIPEIALRAQVMYRSEVRHENMTGDGTATITDSAFVSVGGRQVSVPVFFGQFDPSGRLGAGVGRALAGAAPSAGTVLPVRSELSDSISPQSLAINVQTGIAPGTLLLGSFRWTDWSTNKNVTSTIFLPDGSSSSSYSPYNWRDGYTASIGIGKAFNEEWAGTVSLGYDRGVSTGSETTYTDLYTVSGGFSYKPQKNVELRVGGLVGYWTEGEQKVSEGAYFDAKVGDTFVYAGNASIKFAF
jgi:long-chain fatty acid transport protein